MSHLKRHAVPKNWPIPRKGTTFVVKPSSGDVPILVVLRDMLKVAQNRKEVKKALHEKLILVNTRIVKDEKQGFALFDTISIVPSKKYYRLELNENGKFKLSEIKEQESAEKVSKIVDKKVLKHKKVQINLLDGRNFITDTKCKTNDSVLIDFKNKKISRCLELKEKAKVVVFAGKHAGEHGVINKIDEVRKMVDISEGNLKVHVLIKQLMVIN